MTLKYSLSEEEDNGKCCDPLYVAGGCLAELKSSLFWRGVAAELLGTGILVFFGAGSTISLIPGSAPTVGEISWAAGLGAGTSIWMLAHLSGAHINPSITFGNLLTRKISLLKALLYVVAQCAGSIGASFILKLLTPPSLRGNLGATLLNPEISVVQGLFVEFLITFVLVFCFFATTDEKRVDLRGSGPLSVALAVVVCHLFGLNYTGASMNTAASLGPAVVMGIWTDFWVYVCGPISGGIFGALLYDNVFTPNASWRKTKAFLTNSRYNSNDY